MLDLKFWRQCMCSVQSYSLITQWIAETPRPFEGEHCLRLQGQKIIQAKLKFSLSPVSAGLLLGLILGPGDWGDKFLWKVRLSPNYAVLLPRFSFSYIYELLFLYFVICSYIVWPVLSVPIYDNCRSQCPRGLSHDLSSLDRTLESWVRIAL
jgi:hypothetical protein